MARHFQAWLATAILSVVVGGVVWAVVHFLGPGSLPSEEVPELRDDQLADARAQIKRLQRDLSLEGKRRSSARAVLASLQGQLASAQRQLMAAPRPRASFTESPRPAKFDSY